MMKKRLYLRLLLVIFTLMASFPMFAHDIEVKNADGVTIYYGWRNDSELYVTYRELPSSYSGIVVIPESVNYGGKTYSVTGIGSGAFMSCRSLTYIAIPNSVTTINSYAFEDCDRLTSLTIPNSVTHIGEFAFTDCFNLTTIVSEIKNPFEISDAFYHKFSDIFPATLIVPAGTKSLYQSITGWNKFQNIVEATEEGVIGQVFEVDGIYYIIGENNTISVTSGEVKSSGNVVIPSSVTYNGVTFNVTSIDKWAFSGCNGLTSITIPNSVTSIGESAFSNCSSLNSITIPQSVSTIGRYAFSSCGGLDNIVVEKGNTTYDSRDNCNAIVETSSNILIRGCNSTMIPNSVTSIGDYAFYGCSGLTSITIPNSVTNIGDYAFYGCSGLTSITIPNSVTNIGDYAFYGCSGLTSITIPNSVTSIGRFAFSSCSSLTSVAIPNSVTSIDYSAFSDCSGLTSITIPNSVTSIGSSAFSGCSILTSITIPNSVTSIGSSAFFGTGWYNNQLDGALYLDNCLLGFKGNNKPSGAFVIKDGTRLLAGSSFSNNTELTSVTIPNSVISIGNQAFYDCKSLTSVIIPNSVTSIGIQAFERTAWYDNQPDGLVYAGKVAYEYKGEMPANTEIVIKEGTLGISTYAFSHSGLVSVTIPKSVINIGENALYECSNLDYIFVDKDNKMYDSRDNCNAIIETGTNCLISGCRKTVIPNSVTSIGRYAFYYCSSLTSINIPNSVTSIEDYAFNGCKSLTTIISEIEKPFIIDSNTFSYDTYIVAELIVPFAKRSAYQAMGGWNKFTMITEADDKDEVHLTIDGVTYEGSKSAKSVEVKSVDKSKTSLEIPAVVSSDGTTYTVTGITDKVFDGCNMAALVWDVEAALPNNAFNNASISSNFLLYVKSAAYAPSTVKNVVVDGTAQTIVLSDNGGQFYCPQTFIARSISYTHNYTMETGGNGKGWEALALPFFVQKINHSTRGEIVPFALFSSSSSQKPFWLAKYSGSGFKRTSAIEANEPYIIAMPNNSKYRNEYNLAGEVTFSAENAAVPKTPDFDGKFLPAFAPIAKSDAIMALNNSVYPGVYEPGSHFVKNLRDVHPFEAYMTGSSSTRGVIEICFDDGMTDIDDVLISVEEDQEIVIHNLSGQQVARTALCDFDAVWQQLAKGVYIVNGKKMIK